MSRHIIALLLCASSAAADYVVDWRVPQDNDANANAWVAAVTVPVGEKVVLEWTDYFAFHNVFRMKDKAAYDACDFTGAVELAPSAATGSVAIEARSLTPRRPRASSPRAAEPAQCSQASRADRARTKSQCLLLTRRTPCASDDS